MDFAGVPGTTTHCEHRICQIIDNSALYGGGAALKGSATEPPECVGSIDVTNCLFNANTVEGFGAQGAGLFAEGVVDVAEGLFKHGASGQIGKVCPSDWLGVPPTSRRAGMIPCAAIGMKYLGASCACARRRALPHAEHVRLRTPGPAAHRPNSAKTLSRFSCAKVPRGDVSKLTPVAAVPSGSVPEGGAPRGAEA